MVSFIKNKVQIKASFFVCAVIIIALRLTEQFFIIFFAVSIHELSHVLAAKMFGLDTEKIIITPIGQMSVISDIKQVSLLKQILILSAGPAMNFCMAGAAFAVFRRLSFFISANLLIGIFNLLPIYPLDGGRILHSLLEKAAGTLRANKVIICLSSIFSKALIIMGMVQVIVYPFNMSLLMIGVYINKSIKEEKIFLALEYYRKLIKQLE